MSHAIPNTPYQVKLDDTALTKLIAGLRFILAVAEREQRRRQEAAAIQRRIDVQRGWLTALAYARQAGLDTSLASMQRLGRVATTLCRARRITPVRIPNWRYGYINRYPVVVLREAAQIATGQA